MASTIKVKRSAVQGKAPTTGNLETGELALNTRDGRLYSKGTQVFEVGANTHSLFVGAGGATFANGAYSLPTADGSAEQILKTNGSGILSFTDAAAAGGSIIFYEYDGTRDDIALSGALPVNDALANTNAYIATRASEADSLSRLANTNAYIASVSATERSALANTNAYIATKLDSSSYTTADVQSKASLANTNAYIASVSATERSALANTNAYIASVSATERSALANTNSYIASVSSTERSALANTNAYIASVQSDVDANESTERSALANTNAYIASVSSTERSALANTNAYIATKVAQSGANNSAKIPYGTTAQRDGSPDTGFFRYNVTTSSAEIYDGSAWGAVGGGGGASGGGSDAIFYENGKVITTSYSITADTNAMSTGPLTVNSGVSVTVPSGSRWVVL
jgi:hypothetical protein